MKNGVGEVTDSVDAIVVLIVFWKVEFPSLSGSRFHLNVGKFFVCFFR